MKWGFFAASRNWYANLKWYECFWVMLPIALTSIGGAVGGLCGGAAMGVNFALMRSGRSGRLKYLLSGAVTLFAVGAYVVLAKLLLNVTGLGGATPESVDRELKMQPLYAAAATADPQGYAKVRTAVIDALNHGKARGDVDALLHAYAGTITKKSLPVASDAAVTEFTRVLTLEIDQIGAKSADACHDFLFPRPGAPFNILLYITPDVAHADADASAAVIETAAAHPQRIPERAEIADALRAVGRQLVAQYGAADVAGLSRPAELPHAEACAMIGTLYKNTLALPSSDRVHLLRYLFAQTPGA